MDEGIKWLDRDAAAKYLSVRVDQLRQLQKEGKLPEPSFLFGPRKPRWDRAEIDRKMGGSPNGGPRRPNVDAALEALAAAPYVTRRGQARLKAQARR